MERIFIQHNTGYLDINIEAFFPCTVQKAKKVFALINRFCPYEDRAALMVELQELMAGYNGLCEMYQSKADALPEKSRERKHWLAQYRKTDALWKRMRRNIELLEVTP